jgi:hypothetical protein
VPSALESSLLRGVDQLASQTPVCVPRVAPVAVAPVEPVITVHERGHHDRKHRVEHHGKHHGHGERG